MNRKPGENLRSDIRAGDVQGAGIVIGHGSSASVQQSLPPSQCEAIALLDEFLRLLASHESSVADASGIRESAVAARTEVGEPSPRWPVVRGLLRGIAAGVAGVSALTGAINNIQALVSHISR
jgi:hypothetical protein